MKFLPGEEFLSSWEPLSYLIKNENSLRRLLYAHAQFLCSLQVSNCQPWVSAIPAAYLLIDCYSTRYLRSLVFL